MTFDDRGVSGHPNHISVHKGVLRVLMLKQFMVKEVLALRTNMLYRKYMSYVDILSMAAFDLNFCVFNPLISWKALKIHNSQFVWFRKLFVAFSSYTYCNSFEVF